MEGSLRRRELIGRAAGWLAAASGFAAVALAVAIDVRTWTALAAAAVLILVSWPARRSAVRGVRPVPLLAYDVALAAAVAVTAATYLWSEDPVEKAGWGLVQYFLALPLLLTWIARAAATRGRVPLAALVAAPLIVLVAAPLAATGVLTAARWELAKSEFEAAALDPPPRGEGRDQRIGTFQARVFTADNGSVRFRFGTWSGLVFVPEGLPDPSPDVDKGSHRPWKLPRWWTYDTD